MQNGYILMSGVGGLVVGYIIGIMLLKKKTGVWEKRLEEAQDKLESLKKDSKSQLKKEQAKVQDIKQKLESTKEKESRLKVELEEKSSELIKAQSSLEEVETAKTKSVELANAHKMARQQAEGRCKQAETLAKQTQKQIEDAQAEVKSLTSEKTTLQQQIEEQTQELRRIRKEFAAVAEGSSGSLEQVMDVFAEIDGSLESILKQLMKVEGQQSAVLSDANGIIVAAAGETSLKEGMAATTRLVGSITTQLEGMVPFEALRSYSLKDSHSNVITGRAFRCAGEIIGLATYGPRAPGERILDGAMANLSAILE